VASLYRKVRRGRKRSSGRTKMAGALVVGTANVHVAGTSEIFDFPMQGKRITPLVFLRGKPKVKSKNTMMRKGELDVRSMVRRDL